MSLWGALESLLWLLWDPPGRQLRYLGVLLGALGRSWAALGPLLGALGPLLAGSWPLLGRSWAALVTLLGRSWDALGRSRALFFVKNLSKRAPKSNFM